MDSHRRTEQQLRFLFEEIDDFAVFFMDLKGLITNWTPSAERGFGWTSQEAEGRRPDFIYTPEDREIERPEFEINRALTTGRAEDKRWHVRKDGCRVYMSGVVALLKDDDGQPCGLAKLTRELTEWKVLQEQRDVALQEASRTASQLSAVLDGVPQALLVGTADRFLMANQPALDLFGFANLVEFQQTEPFATGSRPALELRDFATGRPLPWNQSPYYLALTGTTSTLQARIFHAGNQRVRYFLLAGAPVRQGDEVVAAVLTLTDISAQKSAEMSLARARDLALSASQLKSSFVAQISHEIRTPMSGILGMSQLLLDTNLTGEQKEFASIIESSTRGLLSVVNDVLDFSKVESGNVVLNQQPFELLTCLKDATDLFRGAALERGLKLTFQADPGQVVGDVNRIRQVLLNLVNNAIKFTREGSVSVEARVSRADEGRWKATFWVRDTGIGIPQDELASVFQPFRQVLGEQPSTQLGTGLGLAICHQLVELLGGQLKVESEVGIGSVFWFEIPVGEATLAPPTSQAETPSTRAHDGPTLECRVLVVDDNPVNRQIARLQLQKMGHQVMTANDGEEALSLLAEQPFDLVFMDFNMPKLDGPETVRRLRSQEGPNREVSVIALTAMAMSADRARCLAAGMNDYLTKPIVFDELRAVVARWVPARIG